jgi:glycine betaine transporter
VSTPELTLFATLDQLPLTNVISFLVVVLIALFFISGADAAAVVMGMMACRGNLEPPRFVVAVLGLLMGAIAAAMLLVGGLSALQQGAILASVPFTFVCVGLGWSLFKALRAERVGLLERAARVPIAPQPGGVSSDG